MKGLFLFYLFLYETISDLLNKSNHSVDYKLRGLTEQLIQDKVNKNAQHCISVKVGGQNIKVKLTTSFCGFWLFNYQIFNRGFKPEQSTTYLPTNLQDEMEYVSGTVAHETFELDNAVVERVPFLLVDKADALVMRYNYDGIMGYAFSCENQLSRVDLFEYQTRNNKSLSNVISFLLYKDSVKGFLDVGLYPPKLHLYPKYYKTSKVKNSSVKTQWSIYFDSIYFEDNTFRKINDYLTIGINGNVISVRKEFFYWFVGTYFSKLINDKKCKVNIDEIYELLCDFDSELPQIGVMSLIVGKWNIKVNTENLVRIVERGIKKQWYAMVFFPDHDQYYIPQDYLKGIYVVYDKNKSEVGFMYKPQRNSDHTIID